VTRLFFRATRVERTPYGREVTHLRQPYRLKASYWRLRPAQLMELRMRAHRCTHKLSEWVCFHPVAGGSRNFSMLWWAYCPRTKTFFWSSSVMRDYTYEVRGW